MQNHFGLLDTDAMPIFMIISLDIIITLRFSISCSTVICLPTVLLAILREASSETYGPGSIFHHISFRSTIFQSFTFRSINQKTQSYLLYRLFSSIYIRSHVANNHEGIDNPFITLGASWCLFVQVFGGLHIVSYWIDTLVL